MIAKFIQYQASADQVVTLLVTLTTKQVKALKEPGLYSDGAGLYLKVRPSARYWVLRGTLNGIRVERSLGPEWTLSLAEARQKAAEWRKMMRAGIDPADPPRAATFEHVARDMHAHYASSWSKGHAARWLSQLEARAFPVLGELALEDVKPDDIARVVGPIWASHQVTAKALLQRIHAIFEYGVARGVFAGLNPATGVRRIMPPVRRRVEPRRAMPWQEVPEFYAELVEREAMSALALRFLILTAVRSTEAREARWDEIDQNAAVWTIPPERMKTRNEHRVPVALEALRILEAVRGLDTEWVFPSPARRPAAPLSINAFRPLFERMGRDVTVHGFRTSFRSWSAEAVRADREIAELALAHRIGSAVEQAYQRSDLLERRRSVMARWSAFVTGQAAPSADVVQLRR